MNERKDLSPELAVLHERCGSAQGRTYWRSLEELADSPAFQELMRGKFPAQASQMANALSRRQFLTLMGASLALAGLNGCSIRPAPQQKIVPYVRQPEELVPGKPLFYATAMELDGRAVGLLVESHEGRPTKVEGNPDHPASLGATDAFAQASVLTLYDPDRSQTVTYLGRTSTWDEAARTLRGLLERQREPGAGLRILTETVLAPTLAGQLRTFLQQFGRARWHQYEPIGRDSERAGTHAVFNEHVNTYYRFDRAERILSLDADFVLWGNGHLRYVREFINGRRVRGTDRRMNRLYVVEPAPTPTGAKADHRLALPASRIEAFATALASRLHVAGAPAAPTLSAEETRWVDAVADDLDSHHGASLVLAGPQQPPLVHALALAINHKLENAGKTVIHTVPVEADPVDHLDSLRELVQDLKAGRVETLLILGGNPVYTAPADLGFREALAGLRGHQGVAIHLSLYQDETSRECHWHLPQTHYLEAWGDVRTYNGLASIVQPLIAPLYEGRSSPELLALLLEGQERPGHEIVRDHWRQHWENAGRSGDFDTFWQTALHDGVVAGTEVRELPAVSVKAGWAERAIGTRVFFSRLEPEGLEIVFRPDPTLYDGRFANNGWLQELPKPITKLTWDNAVLLSPATARELDLVNELGWHGGSHGETVADVVELTLNGRTIERAPIFIVPGHADRSVTVYLGHGRTHAGRVGNGTGFNANLLRTSDQPWIATGLQIRRIQGEWRLGCTQHHHLMEGRDLVRANTLAGYAQDPRFATKTVEHHHVEEAKHSPNEEGQARRPLPTLYPTGWEERYRTGYRWGMAIDLTACVGCKACVVACQAENNIPVVGKAEVLRGREMHWLRIDTYHTGTADVPKEIYFQPVPCMQCENAPCELVCPVGATVHSSDGLNDMVYNRCVGTRYCSNNCPYKVRRFNFFEFSDFATESRKLQYNPDVTVRSRGVMEKCTYCVQRIRHAEIDAEKNNRRVRDGEVLTACQAACPAEAILFGDLNDPASKVTAAKKEPLNYALLEDLNTWPRTTYLAALRNPNEALTKT